MRHKLPLQVVLEDLGSLHRLVKWNTGNVPSTDDEIVGVDHWKHLRDRYEDVLAGLWLGSDPHSGGSDKRTDVVWLLKAILGVPGDVVLVGEVSRDHSRTVVTTETDEEEAMESQSKKKLILKSTHPTRPTLALVKNS